jgi:hypothetical protein
MRILTHPMHLGHGGGERGREVPPFPGQVSGSNESCYRRDSSCGKRSLHLLCPGLSHQAGQSAMSSSSEGAITGLLQRHIWPSKVSMCWCSRGGTSSVSRQRAEITRIVSCAPMLRWLLYESTSFCPGALHPPLKSCSVTGGAAVTEEIVPGKCWSSACEPQGCPQAPQLTPAAT